MTSGKLSNTRSCYSRRFWAFCIIPICLFVAAGGKAAVHEHGLSIRFNYTANIPDKRVIGYRLYKEGYQACETVQTDSETNPKTVTCTIQSESGTYPFTLSVLFKSLVNFQVSESPQSGPFMFTLALKGDLNCDDTVDLKDVIIGLQALTNLNPNSSLPDKTGDVNKDGKIGLAEVIYCLNNTI